MTYPKSVLESRLKWLMFVRLLLAVVFILFILFIEFRGRGADPDLRIFSFRYLPAYWILTGVCALNLVYLIAVTRKVELDRLATLQVTMDVFIVSALVYFTGIDRIFAFFYFAVILSSALLIRPTYSFLFASLATIMLSSVSILYYLGGHQGLTLPLVTREVVEEHTQRLQFLLPYLFSFAVSLHLAALLSYKLAQELIRIRILSEEVLQNVEGGVIAVDPEGHILYINREAQSVLSLPPGPLEGKNVRDVVTRTEVTGAILLALAQLRRYRVETEIGGVPIEIATSVMFEEGAQTPRGVVVILRDLTMRKQLESMKILEERFRTVVELSASMAHEIRNPLASIKGASQELSGATTLGPDDQKLLSLLVAEVDRLDKLLSSFLEYASLKPMEFKVCDLSQVLQDIAVLLESRSRDKRVQIQRKIPDGVYCKVDEDKLRQVLLNVGINAIEAVKEGGQVTLACLPNGKDAVTIEVSDNGVGIAKDNLHRVFDPFFSTKAKGTGMGLSIARKIIQAHKGTMALESEIGRGTKVRIVLPA